MFIPNDLAKYHTNKKSGIAAAKFTEQVVPLERILYQAFI